MDKYGGFNHNVQTVRIVTVIENKYYKFPGLNLTIETLDGLIKHNGPVKDITLYKKIMGNNLFDKKINFDLFPSLEAQIASISDDIAYNNHDLEDGLKAGLLDVRQLISIPLLKGLINKHLKNIKKFNKNIVISQIVRELINLMVVDVINTTNKNLKRINPQSINDINKQGELVVDFSNKMKMIDSQIKAFLKINMYNHKKVLTNTNIGKKIVNDLFKYLLKNSKRHINKSNYRNGSKERVIADFISGMTDRYAINLHKKVI
tara:strand:- start:104 stop:889 length:786 start_codon:yes stop_codon:yes gene_type:complete